MFRPTLFSLFIGARLATAGGPPECAPVVPDAPTPAFDVLTFTVIATVAPTIQTWQQVLEHICPGAPVPGAGAAPQGGGLSASQARQIVYIDHLEGPPSQAPDRLPAAWEGWGFVPTLVYPASAPGPDRAGDGDHGPGHGGSWASGSDHDDGDADEGHHGGGGPGPGPGPGPSPPGPFPPPPKPKSKTSSTSASFSTKVRPTFTKSSASTDESSSTSTGEPFSTVAEEPSSTGTDEPSSSETRVPLPTVTGQPYLTPAVIKN